MGYGIEHAALQGVALGWGLRGLVRSLDPVGLELPQLLSGACESCCDAGRVGLGLRLKLLCVRDDWSSQFLGLSGFFWKERRYADGPSRPLGATFGNRSGIVLSKLRRLERNKKLKLYGNFAELRVSSLGPPLSFHRSPLAT